MTARTRQVVVLVVVLAAGGVGYWLWPSGRAAGGFGSASRAGARGTQAGGSSEPVIDIRIELLQRKRGTLAGPERNPFRFERRTSEAAAAAAAARQQAARRPAPVDVAPAGPLPPPPPPPIPLRYIGYLQPRGAAGRVAVLSDGRGNVFNGREGEVIEGRYRLLRVGNDSAELVYLDGRGRQTIRLSGQ